MKTQLLNFNNNLPKNKSNSLKNSAHLKLLLLLITIQIKASLQTQIENCENQFNICNGYKCSIYSNCFYTLNKIEDLEKMEFSAECVCKSGYATYAKDGNITMDTVRCCYKKVDLFNAFISECFIGFGFGYLFMGNYSFFFIKFIFQACICCVVCFSGYCLNIENEKKRKKDKNVNVDSGLYLFCNFFNFGLILVFVIWKIVDFFIFGLNLVTDANGMPLDNEW